MMRVNRRRFLPLFLLSVRGLPAVEPGTSTARGTLDRSESGAPALRTPEGKVVYLDGDEGTLGVLKDARLKGTDFEALGHFTAPDRFSILPIYRRALFVHKDGKRLMVTYWCEVCGIRSYTPGLCWCCQQETELDLRENL